MTEKPKQTIVYARITGFAGLPGGGDVFLTEGDPWDVSEPYAAQIVRALGGRFFTAQKPGDASDG